MHVKLDEGLADPKLEPRLNQILLPLLSVVSDADLRSDLGCMAAGVAASLVADWGMSVEAQVLEIVADVMTGSERRLIPLADIVAIFSERYGFEYERPICCDVFVFNAVSDSRSAFRCRPGSVL
jgi:hypothetical protein